MINLCFIFKSRHLLSYLRYQRYHPQYTKYNTALLLAQRVIRIVSENNEHHLSKLKFFLIKRGQPDKVPDYTITKPFSASFESLSLFTISPYQGTI